VSEAVPTTRLYRYRRLQPPAEGGAGAYAAIVSASSMNSRSRPFERKPIV
jgi:hypothetical protein